MRRAQAHQKLSAVEKRSGLHIRIVHVKVEGPRDEISADQRRRPCALSCRAKPSTRRSGSHVEDEHEEVQDATTAEQCQSNTVRPSTLFKQNCEF